MCHGTNNINMYDFINIRLLSCLYKLWIFQHGCHEVPDSFVNNVQNRLKLINKWKPTIKNHMEWEIICSCDKISWSNWCSMHRIMKYEYFAKRSNSQDLPRQLRIREGIFGGGPPRIRPSTTSIYLYTILYICIWYIYILYIHISYYIYIYSTLITWANKRCGVGRTVPEAIHNQVAIKLLVSGLLTWRILCYVYLFVTYWQVLYLNDFCSVKVICHFNI